MDQELQEELNGAETIGRVADIYETLIMYNYQNIGKVNKTIIDKWGMSGLMSVKKQAWKKLENRGVTA